MTKSVQFAILCLVLTFGSLAFAGEVIDRIVATV
jgi:hypothetical protein